MAGEGQPWPLGEDMAGVVLGVWGVVNGSDYSSAAVVWRVVSGANVQVARYCWLSRAGEPSLASPQSRYRLSSRLAERR